MFRCLPLVALLAVISLPAYGEDKARAAAAPAKEKAPYHLSPMIIKNTDAIEKFICGEAETTQEDMMAALQKTFFALMEKEGQDGAAFDYPAIFIYEGNTGDPKKKFKLTTGFPAKENAKAIGEFKVKKVEGIRCASVYYTGSLEHIGKAYESLFTQLIKAGHKPTGETRELYLFWAGEASPNTVVELQAAIAPADKEAPKPDDKKGAKRDDGKQSARVDTTKLVIQKLADKCEVFNLNVGRYPNDLGELVAQPADEKSAEKWRGPYVTDRELTDAWGNALHYETNDGAAVGGRKFKLWSGGPDGKSGTEDDVR
jgi:general secretion pathway protein G